MIGARLRLEVGGVVLTEVVQPENRLKALLPAARSPTVLHAEELNLVRKTTRADSRVEGR